MPVEYRNPEHPRRESKPSASAETFHHHYSEKFGMKYNVSRKIRRSGSLEVVVVVRSSGVLLAYNDSELQASRISFSLPRTATAPNRCWWRRTLPPSQTHPTPPPPRPPPAAAGWISSSLPSVYATTLPRTRLEHYFPASTPPSSTISSSNDHGVVGGRHRGKNRGPRSTPALMAVRRTGGEDCGFIFDLLRPVPSPGACAMTRAYITDAGIRHRTCALSR
ncbi:hypothetical protein B0H19DRAFT_1080385 [Mycena capillaripes]|nr:hypothetical protein B0H19DRAFT_1080385 [Mycena capillaripes]